MKKPLNPKLVGLKYGFRSGLEERVAQELVSQGIPVQYEAAKVGYNIPSRDAKYTPDFILPNGIIIETKGRFATADRQKHILIKKQFPSLDLRFVFSNSRTKISKKSQTSYAMWCDKHGFQYADKSIPKAWIREQQNPEAYKSLQKAILSHETP